MRLHRRGAEAALCLCGVLFVLALSATARADPFIDEVVSFTPGVGAGFGADELPGIVLGPPRGAGVMQGSLDTISLGSDGSIVVAFRDAAICDGPGPDFTVFENAFRSGGTGPVFTEAGIVSVSTDGQSFVEFPYDAETLAGLAGITPVLSHPDNGVDPLDPEVSGGDAFDLAQIGVAFATYVRIVDPGAAIDDLGNLLPGPDTAGFDLDAIAALHECVPGSPVPTSSPTATPTTTPTAAATATFDASPTPTHTRVSTPTRTPTATPIVLPGDANGDRAVDEADRSLAVGEIFDGDGDSAGNVAGGLVFSFPGVDGNSDGLITVADLLLPTPSP